jgi:hypothetical protein
MEPEKLVIKQFISEAITVLFSTPPAFSKTPSCPDGFTWRNKYYAVAACLSEQKDFSRRGRMHRNMQPQHAKIASKHGSWGVGRFHFEVQTKNGRLFHVFYDRAPQNAFNREGKWVLLSELMVEKD